jgi:hypothetical protein
MTTPAVTPVTPLDAPAGATGQLADPFGALRSADAPITTSFASMLGDSTAAVGATDDADDTDGIGRVDASDRVVPVSRLLKLLLILEILGLEVPQWMIRAFKAHGMVDLAQSLVARNRRIRAERDEALAQQQRLAVQAPPPALRFH